MPITIYGTDWCDDTRRTRAFLAAKGIRPKFIDIDARPDEAAHLSTGGHPISIPVVVFPDGGRFDDPSEEELEASLTAHGMTAAVRHRTKLNQSLNRFEQYRNDQLVASASFIERSGTVVIVRLDHHEPRDPALEDDNVERLTSGLVEIVNKSNRTVDIDLGASPDEPAAQVPATLAPAAQIPATQVPASQIPAPLDPASDTTEPPSPTAGDIAAETSSPRRTPAPARPRKKANAPLHGSTAEALQEDAPAETCLLSQRFNELWSSGVEHREAARLGRSEGLGRLAIVKALHAMWEMPLTPEAMALAFGDKNANDLAAMFHVLGWIVSENPASTMSEFQAFDDATGISIKTQALSLAKRPRDTIAVVDRMSSGLQLRTIDESRAREMAALTIREADGLLRIQDQSTLRMSFGWMFLYQSVEYFETGDYSTMISGNAPLLVDRFTGALWITETEERPDVYAANYIATGNPLQRATPDR